VDLQERAFSRTIAIAHQGIHYTGWVKAQFEDDSHTVRLLISQSLSPVVSLVAGRLRELLDLDADPLPIDAQLAPYFPQSAGLRVPGTLDGFELAVRAILGQQITVAAARTLAQRMVEQLGTSVATPFAQLTRCFPDAHTVARTPAETLGAMGIVRQRQRAIHALANAVAHDHLVLDATAPVAATLEQLQALPGIGAWTANYIAMRALRWPDAFPSADVALHTALGVRAHAHPAQEAERIAQAWRPWRSYGVLRAWAGTGERPIPPATPTPPRGGPR
jgi:AraC family transcriptional regulator of adaptative response / DNA-3-methyladenine glycosylase II